MSIPINGRPLRRWSLRRMIVSYGVAIGLIVLAAIWISRNWEEISRTISLNPVYAAMIVPVVFLSLLVVGLINQLAATHLGAPLRFREWSSLALGSTFANYVFPARAGALMRATYLKFHCGLSVAAFASTMAAVYVMTLLTNSVLGLGLLGWFWYRQGLESSTLAAIFAVVIAVCGLLLSLPIPLRRTGKEPAWWQFVIRFHAGWESVRRSHMLLARLVGLIVLLTGLYAVRLYCAFAATGNPLGPAGCMLVATMTAIATFLAFTPAGLGIQEAAIVFVSLAIGVSPEVSLMAAAIDRAVSMAVVAVFGLPAMMRISREIAAETAGRSQG
jgi:uncharacterized membrane protein YbhN (UPF0104 family)